MAKKERKHTTETINKNIHNTEQELGKWLLHMCEVLSSITSTKGGGAENLN